jgi:hypothetical protein
MQPAPTTLVVFARTRVVFEMHVVSVQVGSARSLQASGRAIETGINKTRSNRSRSTPEGSPAGPGRVRGLARQPGGTRPTPIRNNNPA